MQLQTNIRFIYTQKKITFFIMYHILSDYDLRTIFFLLFSYIEISIMSQKIAFDKEEKESIMTQHSEDNSKTARTVPRLIRRPDSDSISLWSIK